MPSTTTKQARTMAAASHDPAFAAKLGIPQKVATEFNEADTGSELLKQSARARHLRARAAPPDA